MRLALGRWCGIAGQAEEILGAIELGVRAMRKNSRAPWNIVGEATGSFFVNSNFNKEPVPQQWIPMRPLQSKL